MRVASGGSWLVDPVGTTEQFTGATFTDEDVLYAKTAEDFVRNEVLPRIDAIEAKEEGLMRGAPEARRRARPPDDRRPRGVRRTRAPARPPPCWCRSAARCARRSACRGGRTPASARCRSSTTAPRRRSSTTCRSSPPASGSPATRSPSRSPGSDALAARTKAVLEPDGAHYRLTGTKQFITNAGFADLFTVFAKVDGEAFTAFLVERDTPGVSLGPEEHKLGIRGSSTRQLILEDVPVPADHVLGEDRPGPQDRVQHPEHRPLQARRRRGRRRQGVPPHRPRLRRRPAAVRPPDRQLRHDPAQARRHGDADLRRGQHELPHGRVDGRRSRGGRSRPRPTRRRSSSRRRSRSTRSRRRS